VYGAVYYVYLLILLSWRPHWCLCHGSLSGWVSFCPPSLCIYCIHFTWTVSCITFIIWL